MKEVIIATPKEGEKAIRVITVTFMSDGDVENSGVYARYEITTVAQDVDNAFEEPCIGIDFGLGRFTVCFADHGQTEKEAVTKASGILFETLSNTADDIAFIARCHKEALRND